MLSSKLDPRVKNGFALCTVFLLNFEEIFAISSPSITTTWLNG